MPQRLRDWLNLHDVHRPDPKSLDAHVDDSPRDKRALTALGRVGRRTLNLIEEAGNQPSINYIRKTLRM